MDVLPETAERVEQWSAEPRVLGVILVGSRSRGHSDELSDDDLEVVLTDEAHAALSPSDVLDRLVTGEGEGRKLIYDAQYISLPYLQKKAHSTIDLDRWPYERARVLFNRSGEVARAVEAAGRMDPEFRSARLRHATIDASVAHLRAAKTLKRGIEGASRLLIARGVQALSRVLFALEWRWVPLDHWWEAELRTLQDPQSVGPLMVEALISSSPEPLGQALERLEDTLYNEGVPRPAGRRDLFLDLLHPSHMDERAIHGLR